ncbi:NADH-quinone oxidoreductase subunit J [Lysobacter sp. S4-A87]|uniref:NADH-quinone oxidoreductase subunit J n=1 Tax=Lysobacter sp. S4-A87 TaxID=2925843 RepID=UPI001F52EAA4|nr:NADH-quinone oxidoreductase subunit J [Lysobacter sp. S4-A87]UNK50190.1 NADH-quinone oxidoreductase subunit J [Lysobacter sp. S4-A87]
MDLAQISFFVFAAVATAAAVGVISVRNPVHAVLFLVLTFFSVACTWIIAGAEFLGVALILVYVGAVMVLLLFVVMMLDIDVAPLREGYVRYLPVGLVVAVVMLVEMLTLIGVKAKVATAFTADVTTGGNTAWLARALFTQFLLPFELAAVILTVAVIAAVTLTLRRRPGAKHQSPSAQARVRAGDRLRMVKMDAVRPVPAAVDAPAEESKP